MENIVSQAWLLGQLGDANIVIADCRFALGKPESGRQGYEQDHIPGAVYVDLEKDLSGAIMAHGGRHPLPDLGAFSILVGSLGIDSTKTVVAYDDQGGAMASRLWWMLKFLGHAKVHVLDQGYTAWKSAGYPVTAEVAEVYPRTFSPKVQRTMLASMDEVKDKLGRPGVVLVDSREERRYLGLEEPIDPVAGHIPGARNYFWRGVLDEAGAWLPAAKQEQHFAGLRDADEIIVYCGSGVTACPNVLGLSEAGFDHVKLYSGSWSDWISWSDNPIATGEE